MGRSRPEVRTVVYYCSSRAMLSVSRPRDARLRIAAGRMQTQDCIKLCILLWLVATSFLIYRFAMRSQRVERRFLLPESEDEARTRYKAAWQKYRRLRLMVLLSIPGWFVFSILVSGLFWLFGWNQKIAMVFILAYIAGWSFMFAHWNDWQCPRCGRPFKWQGDLVFPNHCQHCNLPKWAESSAE